MQPMAWARAAPEILVVDDDHDIRELTTEVLVLAGYRVRSARNGRVALEQARRLRPDLIVLDLMMPEMSGWEFLEAQREDTLLHSIPVIVVTAGTDTYAEGAAALMRKPLDVRLLLAIVARLCGGGRDQLDQLSA